MNHPSTATNQGSSANESRIINIQLFKDNNLKKKKNKKEDKENRAQNFIA